MQIAQRAHGANRFYLVCVFAALAFNSIVMQCGTELGVGLYWNCQVRLHEKSRSKYGTVRKWIDLLSSLTGVCFCLLERLNCSKNDVYYWNEV